jgi:hypothetical protein
LGADVSRRTENGENGRGDEEKRVGEESIIQA